MRGPTALSAWCARQFSGPQLGQGDRVSWPTPGATRYDRSAASSDLRSSREAEQLGRETVRGAHPVRNGSVDSSAIRSE